MENGKKIDEVWWQLEELLKLNYEGVGDLAFLGKLGVKKLDYENSIRLRNRPSHIPLYENNFLFLEVRVLHGLASHKSLNPALAHQRVCAIYSRAYNVRDATAFENTNPISGVSTARISECSPCETVPLGDAEAAVAWSAGPDTPHGPRTQVGHSSDVSIH
ncbi:hypothetical protein K458DRAFT_410326 [Lentithecium fluviatile CBS 122367]|uniref:Uncharacterized protein n=1 Tax=Lentithecium fluviatile CBS 122367 TaxID=1168545 RepID=A0A6G1IF69_9PLEO|nr:hypothetical protein K458DRAFT_410326 [Lentithecium fluviatile CBS 122367]